MLLERRTENSFKTSIGYPLYARQHVRYQFVILTTGDGLTDIFSAKQQNKRTNIKLFCLCTRCCLNTSRATTHLILITALRNRCPPLCKLGSRATQRLNNLSEVAHLIRSRSKGYNVRGRRTLSVYCQGILELVEAANPVNFTSLFYR